MAASCKLLHNVVGLHAQYCANQICKTSASLAGLLANLIAVVMSFPHNNLQLATCQLQLESFIAVVIQVLDSYRRMYQCFYSQLF